MAVWYGLLILALWMVAGIGWAVGSLWLGVRFEVRRDPRARRHSPHFATHPPEHDARVLGQWERSRPTVDSLAVDRLLRRLAERERQRAAVHARPQPASGPSAVAAR